MYQWIFPVFLFLIICAVVVYLSHSKLHRLRRTIVLTKEHYSRLFELAKRSLETSDVPVGALLLYKGEIIGEGFNTVLRNAKAGEHAEVNAISAAIKDLGMEKFTMLERDSLLLATTFEPCLMCAGAFINYNIQNVFFMKEKDFSYTTKEEALFVRYLLRRKQIKSGNEQDVLFEKHPDYPQKKI
jgi:tRNA(Arg) A34 adenosine deaminase TadA